jgi:hypothetical protein
MCHKILICRALTEGANKYSVDLVDNLKISSGDGFCEQFAEETTQELIPLCNDVI